MDDPDTSGSQDPDLGKTQMSSEAWKNWKKVITAKNYMCNFVPVDKLGHKNTAYDVYINVYCKHVTYFRIFLCIC
jgi:hypothetical protein